MDLPKKEEPVKHQTPKRSATKLKLYKRLSDIKKCKQSNLESKHASRSKEMNQSKLSKSGKINEKAISYSQILYMREMDKIREAEEKRLKIMEGRRVHELDECTFIPITTESTKLL